MTKHLDPDWPVFEFKGEDYDIYDFLCELHPNTDRAGREYQMVTQCLEDEDFYQGLNMITVIRRVSDGNLFGYSWWDDISKYGESSMEANGAEYGLECDYMADNFDWENDYIHYFVFEPVEEYPIRAYKKVGQS